MTKVEEKVEVNERKIKVVADQLSVQLRNSRFVKVIHAIAYLMLCGTICFLVTRGNVVVVGDNLVATGVGDNQLTSKNVVEVRADGHARLLYDRLFTFDYNNFQTKKNFALYLGDKSIEALYSKLNEVEFYKKIVQNNFVVTSYLDTANVFMNPVGKVNVVCKGRMELSNRAYIETRRLDLNLELVPVAFIKEKNPYGYSIADIQLMSNNFVSKQELSTGY